MSDVVVVGSISIDNVVLVERLPERDEVAMGKGYTHLGGRGANQAVAASRMGAAVSLVSCVGSDHRAQLAIEALENDRVDIQAVYRERSTPTGIAQISVDAFGNRAIAVAPEANNYLLPERIRECEDLISKARVVMVQPARMGQLLSSTILLWPSLPRGCWRRWTTLWSMRWG